MKTVIKAGAVCIALMLGGVAHAADNHQFCYDSKNKSYNLDYRITSDDLKGCITDQDKHDNGGDKGGNNGGDNGNKGGDNGPKGGDNNNQGGDQGGDKGGKGGSDCTITLPPDCTPDVPVCDNHDKSCDNHNPDCNDKKDCDKHDCDDHGDCHKKPCGPTDPNTPAVPLPASSALGGVGLAAVMLMGYARSRKANIA
jgi:hypothetical protein